MSVSGAGGDLTEPVVLAHAKRALFPEDGRYYAVTDTQFATDRWLDEGPIDPEIRSTLSPFNHVRLGTGYPDLVGVGAIDREFLGSVESEDRTPLVAIEAKGYRKDRGVSLDTGIIQARDRVSDANAAYLAAPDAAITDNIRTIARESNVGVLGVTTEGEVRPREVPTAVGIGSPEAAEAIRFQATPQGVAGQSFGLNHPKNYLGYPLALYCDGPTDELVAEHVVGAVDDARKGATFLGLIEERPTREPLPTELGEEVVRFAIREYGGTRAALREFENWKRSRKRFVDVAPPWGQLTRRIVFEYPATKLLVEKLQEMHAQGTRRPTLREFVRHLHGQRPSFAVELFVRNDEAARERVFRDDDSLDGDALTDGDVYHSCTVFQLKAILYHAGILTERGAEPHRLDPTRDVWALTAPI